MAVPKYKHTTEDDDILLSDVSKARAIIGYFMTCYDYTDHSFINDNNRYIILLVNTHNDRACQLVVNANDRTIIVNSVTVSKTDDDNIKKLSSNGDYYSIKYYQRQTTDNIIMEVQKCVEDLLGIKDGMLHYNCDVVMSGRLQRLDYLRCKEVK